MDLNGMLRRSRTEWSVFFFRVLACGMVVLALLMVLDQLPGNGESTLTELESAEAVASCLAFLLGAAVLWLCAVPLARWLWRSGNAAPDPWTPPAPPKPATGLEIRIALTAALGLFLALLPLRALGMIAAQLHIWRRDPNAVPWPPEDLTLTLGMLALQALIGAWVFFRARTFLKYVRRRGGVGLGDSSSANRP